MLDRSLPRVSDGIIVQPFGDGAVAADLVTGRAHLLSAAAAWLLSTDATSLDDLVGDLPETERSEAARRVLDALDTLRTPGLIGRPDRFTARPRPGGSARDPGGRVVGRSHPVLAERIAFRSDDASLLEQVDEFLGSGTDDEPTLFFDLVPNEVDGALDLYTENDWHFTDEDQFFFQLPAVLNDYAVRSHDVIALHAGAVRTPDGRNLVLLGHMNAGKSTLTAACVQAGCDYYSDETVGFTEDLALVGYPKPISIDLGTYAVLGLETDDPKPHLVPEALRPDVARLTAAGRADEVLLLQYDPEASGVEKRVLTPLDALPALCARTLNLARLGEPGLGTLCAVAESIPVSTFRHPGIETAVPALLSGDSR